MSEEVPPLGEVFELIRAVWGVNRGLELVSRRMQDTLGISAPQRFLIRIVGRFPGITARQLTKILCLDRSSISALITRLEDRRLISRTEDPRDRRRSPIVLTAQGRAFDSPAANTVEAAVQRVLKRYSRRDVEIATEVIRALGEELTPTETERSESEART